MRLRGIGNRLRAGGNSFNPSQISFTSGLWLDPSDITTGFQDSAGTTPQTASGQPTGKRLDKSGNGLHVLQATSSGRPEYDVISGISSDYFDGTDDGYSTATFAAGTLVNGMDCFIAIRRASTKNEVVISENPADPSRYMGNISASANGLGLSGTGTAWSAYVNGVAVGSVNSCSTLELNAALGSGAWKVLELRDLDLSLWAQFTLGLYTGAMMNADEGGIILCPAQSSANRTKIRKWLGAKVGLSL